MSRSSTTTDEGRILPIHPGEILMEDFIEAFGITQNKLAVAIGVAPRRINEIVHGKRGITADTAVRLSKYFGTTSEFWMNLQAHYELRIERRALHDQLETIVPLRSTMLERSESDPDQARGIRAARALAAVGGTDPAARAGRRRGRS